MTDVVFQRDNIMVTKTLARFGAVSYPINGIGSVLIQAPTFLNRLGLFICGFFLLIMATDMPPQSSARPLLAIGGLFMMVVVFFLKTKLVLRTASGDQQAYQSRKRQAVEDVKVAIEKAVTLRG